jgi:predicted amidohydrolase YtcJ
MVIASPMSEIAAPADASPLGNVAILPALVNAHTHLELSYLRGLVPPSTSFNDWVMALMALRRNYPDPSAPPIIEAGTPGHRTRASNGHGPVRGRQQHAGDGAAAA